LLGVQAALRIDSDKIVGKNTFNCRRVASGDRFRPLAFAIKDVALDLFLVIVRIAMANAERSENQQSVS